LGFRSIELFFMYLLILSIAVCRAYILSFFVVVDSYFDSYRQYGH